MFIQSGLPTFLYSLLLTMCPQRHLSISEAGLFLWCTTDGDPIYLFLINSSYLAYYHSIAQNTHQISYYFAHIRKLSPYQQQMGSFQECKKNNSLCPNMPLQFPDLPSCIS